jgi:3' terminal RNA ribose 2'-O-methyltransferase Hen1
MATSLHAERLDTVVQALLACGAESVLDLGCGPGDLLVLLAREQQFKRIVGMDTSLEALSTARHRLTLKPGADEGGPGLCQASFTTFVEDFVGFDAAVLVETLEHVAPHRLSAVEQAVFAGYRPKTVLVTTPNREYNVLHGMPEGARRHRDHRFEWSRSKFRTWSEGVARRNGYRVVFEDIGAVDPLLGGSTQMATFSRK